MTAKIPDKKSAHMAKRKGQGLTHKQVGEEFGVSKSTAHRKVSEQSGPSMKWNPSKRPTEKKTDRGTFGFKSNGKNS